MRRPAKFCAKPPQEAKSSLVAFLIKGPLVVISSALLFVVVYLSGIALALAVVVGIYLVLMKLFGE